MKSNNRLGIAVLTGIGSFLLLIGLIFVLTGWFQPEPQYSVNTFQQVVMKEISLSCINLLLFGLLCQV